MRRAILVGGLALAVTLPSAADAKPCQYHAGPAKDRCLAVVAKKAKERDSLRFPPNPTMADVAKRVPDWWGFVRLARCEQPGPGKWGVRWSHQGPTWGGGLGIYRGTWYAAGSPYRLWSGSIPETLLVADAIRDRFGITAWGAWRCF
jgi:hypothetical protein